jgi:threonine dehydratase
MVFLGLLRRFPVLGSLIEGRSPFAVRTPCRLSPELSRAVDTEVFIQLENLQLSGSFKLRGVVNKIRSLAPDQSNRPLIAASTGNHGAAFAHALSELGLEGRLFLPRGAAAAKLRAVSSYGVPYELVGDDCVETEIQAREFARDHGGVLVPPYNDPDVVAGQGTIAVELLDEPGGFDVVLAPVGGGGLIAGIASYLASAAPEVDVIGCQPEASAVMYHSVQAGEIVAEESRPTLADATAGGIEQGSITFELCRRHVADFVLLSEDEIADAIRLVHESEAMVIEGGAALAVAAAVKHRHTLAGRRVVLIISGSRIDDDVLRGILA